MESRKAGFLYSNPYNLVAELICHLRQLDCSAYKSQDVRNTIREPDDLDSEVSLLFEQHPCLRDGKGLVSRGVPPETVAAIRSWKNDKSFIHVLEFLVRLTRVMRLEDILCSPHVRTLESGFSTLNDNEEETGLQIIPRVRTINDLLDPAAGGEDPNEPAEQQGGPGANGKRWATERLPGINDELSHLYYIEKDQLQIGGEPCTVQHHIVGKDFFAGNKKEFVIGASPMVRGDFLEIAKETRSEGNGTRGFFGVTGLKEADVVQDKLQAAILEACRRDVDILIFPEMLGSGEVLGRDFFDRVEELAADEGLPMPSLILFPTWWHDHRNELHVMDGAGGTSCVQQKQYPFVYTDEDGCSYAEDLQNGERVIHVVHVPGLGRLTFPICKDYLQEEYRRLMAETLRSTFLLCPSYSPGKTQFDLAAPGQIQYGCYTVWVNTCAANPLSGSSPEYVGLVSGPLAEGKYIHRLEPTCGGICGGGEDACLFVIRISMDRLANISYTHVHHMAV